MAEDQDAPVEDDAGNADDETQEPVVEQAEPAEKPSEESPATGWPDDWRDRLAEHRSAGNETEFKKEMRRLEKVSDPSLIYGSYRDLENTWHSKGFVKVPGEDATEKEVADYRTALGVPETVQEYFDNASIADSDSLDEGDIASLSSVAESLHEAGATQDVMDAFLNSYIDLKEDQIKSTEAADYEFRGEAQRELRDEFGPGYERKALGVATIFAAAPGGADVSNPDGLFARLLGGRMSEESGGALIGDDPDFIRWAATVAHEINPEQSVIEDSDNGGVGIEEELKQISKARRENRGEYNKDTAMQARERQLLEAQEKIRARA